MNTRKSHLLFFSAVNGNPLLSATEARDFEESIKPFQKVFPSLKELTARHIFKKNIPTNTLPTTLQSEYIVTFLVM